MNSCCMQLGAISINTTAFFTKRSENLKEKQNRKQPGKMFASKCRGLLFVAKNNYKNQK